MLDASSDIISQIIVKRFNGKNRYAYLIIKKNQKLMNSLLFSKCKKKVINFRSLDTFWLSKIKFLRDRDSKEISQNNIN